MDKEKAPPTNVRKTPIINVAEGENVKIYEEDVDGPKRKLIKLSSDAEVHGGTVSLNEKLLQSECKRTLQGNWKSGKSLRIEGDTDIELLNKPFQIGIIQNFLSQKEIINDLVREMTELEWSRKQMDLYEFYQSTDLSNIKTPHLTAFHQMLQKNVMPWIAEMCGIELDYVSASCSMYNCGDYLLVHDDLLKDRQIAFIYYISPWKGAEDWTEEMGGSLEIFNADENCFPRFPVNRKINPRNNQFAFFKVGSKSFHQVGEVTTLDYPRLTINGWFHGKTNTDVISDAMRPFVPPVFHDPLSVHVSLNDLISEIYLKDITSKRIQRHIEDNSEICLEDFLITEKFAKIAEELKSDSLKWTEKGPANCNSYEFLDLETVTGELKHLIDAFSSEDFFHLLYEYTDLDLSGEKATQPKLHVEVQKWTHGSYTVLGDGSLCEENTLDLVYYLNASENVGVITYLSPDLEDGADAQSEATDDDSVLLTITPKDNALSIVYRSEGTTKFTKYVSKRTPLDNGPVFVLCCSYRE